VGPESLDEVIGSPPTRGRGGPDSASLLNDLDSIWENETENGKPVNKQVHDHLARR
jgi:hypothetical protein